MPDAHAIFLSLVFLALALGWSWLAPIFIVLIPLWGMWVFYRFSKVAGYIQGEYDKSRSSVVLLMVCFLYRQFIAACLWIGSVDVDSISWLVYIFLAFILEEICVRIIFIPNDWSEYPPPYQVFKVVHDLGKM